MKITNLGGATAILEHKGKRMLFDPWLDDGIFHGAWYHYPPLRVKIEDIGRFDFIYISHIHEDHCSAGTIRHLNKDAEVLLVDREPNYVVRFLEANDFTFKKIHRVRPFTPVAIAPGLTADMITADPEHDLNFLIDSALVLVWDGFVVYNANDCAPYPGGLKYIKEKYGSPNLALLPYAGGSGYPACYSNLSHEEKNREKERIFKQRLQGFVDSVRTLEPNVAMPFADQYVVGGSRHALNDYMAHPPGAGVVLGALKNAGLEKKALLLNSGQSFDFSHSKKEPDEPYQHFSEDDRKKYVGERLTRIRYDHEHFQLNRSVPLDRLVRFGRERLWEAQTKDGYFPVFSYYLDVSDRRRRFQLDLRVREVREVSWESALREPYLRIGADSMLMALLLMGHISWNIADAALFLDYERVPNIYEPKIHAFVNFLRL